MCGENSQVVWPEQGPIQFVDVIPGGDSNRVHMRGNDFCRAVPEGAGDPVPGSDNLDYVDGKPLMRTIDAADA